LEAANASLSIFGKLVSQAPNVTNSTPPPYRKKLIRFASISGTTSGKSGVVMPDLEQLSDPSFLSEYHRKHRDYPSS